MLSLCSGIGGADLAAEWAGIQVVGQVEIDTFCTRVLQQHWPQVARMRDIREVRGDEFGEIDLLVGGFPCQPFSQAGKRKGRSDERNLWPEIRRILGKTLPRWFVGENVPGLLSVDAGQVFGGIIADLDALGYHVAWAVYGAHEVGASHRRDRLFIVAYSGREQSQRRGSIGALEAKKRSSPEKGPQWERIWHATEHSSAMAQHRTRAGCSVAQPRVGRMPYGLPTGMDRYQSPAQPGESQYLWEPPRTTTQRDPNRAKRLKALGNAIVPQQIFPIFQSIVEIERRQEQ
ncbi:DNA cytosine methyltransferase [Thermosporothrix hazakensis]|nr:DNA (cytosine-5-)-methyltransferase [Thermosporothrix hazakensis]